MIDYSDAVLLKELKREYDKTLKRSYLRFGNGLFNNDFPYSNKYPLYYKKDILNNLIKQMRKDVYKAYIEGGGHELEEGINGRPPKFLSISSSSQFCFTSLNIDKYTNKKEGADYFSHDGESIKRTYFEKQLPILKDVIPPHMDAYAKTRKREHFFECKCHEMFDIHSLSLSKKYFDTGKDFIVDYIPKEYLIDNGSSYIFNPIVFDVEDPLFDIKQLLTHLMGIVCNKSRKECDLIYYYSFPLDEDIKDERIKEVIEKVKSDAIKVFESIIIKKYCLKHHITLRLYAHHSAYHYATSENNTYKIY